MVLDLAVEHFGRAHVRPFYMAFLPGLDYSRAVCRYVTERYDLPVLEVLHWNTTYYLRRGVFGPIRDVPKLTLQDIERRVQQETGLSWIAYGYRASDSLTRRGWMKQQWPNGLHVSRTAVAPIVSWSVADVRRYLAHQRIVMPALSAQARGSAGLNLRPETLAWVRRAWPRDYARILQVFPYAAAQADRAVVLETAARERRRQTAKATRGARLQTASERGE